MTSEEHRARAAQHLAAAEGSDPESVRILHGAARRHLAWAGAHDRADARALRAMPAIFREGRIIPSPPTVFAGSAQPPGWSRA